MTLDRTPGGIAVVIGTGVLRVTLHDDTGRMFTVSVDVKECTITGRPGPATMRELMDDVLKHGRLGSSYELTMKLPSMTVDPSYG